MRVFLSFSFRDDDKLLVDQLQQMLYSHALRPVTGRAVDGEPVTQAVLQRVESCDALVALMTRRDQIVANGATAWRTHPWVRDELIHARARALRAIALVEDAVDHGGAYGDNERIRLDRADPLPAFLALSTRLANWKREHGRKLVAKILPAELAHHAADVSLSCQYRFWSDGNPAEWCDSRLVPAEGGTLLVVRNVADDQALIEVRVMRHGQLLWQSPAVSQHVTIKLFEAGAK